MSAIASWKQFSFELVISPLRVLRRNPQLPYPVHSHKSSEMVMITGGRGVHFTENGIFPVERGHIFVINGGDTHGCQGLNSLCLISLLFGLAKMAIPLLGLSQSTGFHTLFIADPAFRRGKRSIGMLKVYDENYRRLIGLVDSLEGSLEADYPGSRFASLSSFLAILSLFTRIYDEQPFTEEYPYPHRLRAAFSCLDSNLDRIVMTSELVASKNLARIEDI